MALVVIFVGSVYLAYTDQYFFKIKEISVSLTDIDIAPKLKDKLVQELELDLSSYKNHNIWQVSLADLQQQLLKNKWVSSTQIHRRLPNAIDVSIRLNKVAFVYLNHKREFVPITFSGAILEPIAMSLLPDVPVIRDRRILKDGKLRSRLLSLYKSLPNEGLISHESVAEVYWDPLRGMKLELTTYEGAIILGTSNITLRVRRVENVLNYLESQKQRWRVIDASFSKKVLVSMRKHS